MDRNLSPSISSLILNFQAGLPHCQWGILQGNLSNRFTVNEESPKYLNRMSNALQSVLFLQMQLRSSVKCANTEKCRRAEHAAVGPSGREVAKLACSGICCVPQPLEGLLTSNHGIWEGIAFHEVSGNVLKFSHLSLCSW